MTNIQKEELFQVQKIQLAAVKTRKDNNILTADSLHRCCTTKMPNAYGIYRTDNWQNLGVVGENYTAIQNEALFNNICEAADLAGVPQSKIKFLEFQGGRKTAFQMELPSWSIGKDSDKVIRYLSALNSFDGSTSLGFGLTGIRVYCTNTWHQAHEKLQKIMHTANISDRIKILHEEMLNSISVDFELFEMFEKMTKQTYNETDHSKIFKEVLGYDSEELKAQEKNTTRRENKLEQLTDCINLELESAGKNYWGLFNGFTNYTNHVAKKSRAEMLPSVYYGSGKALTDRVLEVLN